MRQRGAERSDTVVELALNGLVCVWNHASESSIAVCCLLLCQLVSIQVLKWSFDEVFKHVYVTALLL